MVRSSPSMQITPSGEQLGDVDTRLRGLRLVLARIVCLSVVGLALGLFFASIPRHFHELIMLSHQAESALQQLSSGAGNPFLQWVLSVNFYPVYVLSLELMLALGFSLAALLVFWQKSDDWRVILFTMAGITYVIYITGSLDALVRTYPLWQFPVRCLQAFGVGAILIYFYTFPNGRFIPSWTRPLAVIWIIWTAVWLFFPAVPFNFSNAYILSFPWSLVLLLWFSTGAFAQFYRYRRLSSRHRRQQVRWVVFSLITTVLCFLLYHLPRMLFSWLNQSEALDVLYYAIGVPLFLSSLLLIPLFYFFSIQRYHLFDIDVLINRTLVYGTLTGSLALIYVGLILALQALLRDIFHQTSDVAIVASTLAIAALFQPLRQRIQRLVDRRFYRRKYDAAKIVAAYSATLRQEVDLDQLREHLLTVVQETMQPTLVSLWLRPPAHDGKHQAPWRAPPPVSSEGR